MNSPPEESPADHSACVSLRPVASLCATGECPTVYVTDRNTVVVQGYPIAAESAGTVIRAGEALVEIPLSLLAVAAEKLA
jgi:hypothetical protein